MMNKREQAVEAALLEQNKKQKKQKHLDGIQENIDRSKVKFQEDSDLEDVADDQEVEESGSDEEESGSG